MDDFVPLSDVLLVLKAKGVAISAVDISSRTYLLAGQGLLEQIIFTDPVSKNRLHYLHRKFKVDVHLFWHPEMLGFKPGENPN